MKIFKLTQNENNGYDTYDEAVVIAENEEEAKQMNPSIDSSGYDWDGWCDLKYVTVEYIGEADSSQTKGFICKSFNAG